MEKYRNLSREELIAKIAALEGSHSSSSRITPSLSEEQKKNEKKRRVKFDKEGNIQVAREFDIRQYPSRKIALRFSYDGTSYNGLATQNYTGNQSRQDVLAVEDVLWKALVATRLVGEKDTMGGVGWSRCGRTDAGVSAGGQVVSLWVRSRKVDQWEERKALEEFVAAKKREQGKDEDGVSELEEGTIDSSAPTTDISLTRIPVEPDSEELAYVSNLNNVLPTTIRIQAWSPVRPHFSSRFDCRYRHYKYFFTSGCPFAEQATTKGLIPSLDIPLMRYAAQKFLGDHDFQNFCRVDASKQIDNFRRRVDGISIDEVSRPWPRSATSVPDHVSNGVPTNGKEESSTEKMYVLNLRGTAFLYHQVRHIVAVLFQIGAGLEKASIIDELLNVEKGALARDRLMMRRRGLVLHDGPGEEDEIKTTLPNSTATTMTGNVASDEFAEDGTHIAPSEEDIDSDDFNPEELALQDCTIYDQKPAYEMASDRPLMLWECGFKESDIEWRSGTYDGSIRSHSSMQESEALNGDINSATRPTIALLHSHWSSLAINTEMYKHFLLALPLDVSQSQAGFIPASTFFKQSSLPTLEKDWVLKNVSKPAFTSSGARRLIPLGNGNSKPLMAYKGLFHAKREETPETKNAKYLHGRGKRRAEKKGEELTKPHK